MINLDWRILGYTAYYILFIVACGAWWRTVHEIKRRNTRLH